MAVPTEIAYHAICAWPLYKAWNLARMSSQAWGIVGGKGENCIQTMATQCDHRLAAGEPSIMEAQGGPGPARSGGGGGTGRTRESGQHCQQSPPPWETAELSLQG